MSDRPRQVVRARPPGIRAERVKITGGLVGQRIRNGDVDLAMAIRLAQDVLVARLCDHARVQKVLTGDFIAVERRSSGLEVISRPLQG